MTVPSTTITICITVHRYLPFFLLSFSFTLWFTGGANSTLQLVLFITPRSGCLAEIRWSVCIAKSPKSLWISRTDAGLGLHHLFVWSNLNFLNNSQWIPFLLQSCLVLYSFCANLLHSLIMWMIWCIMSSRNLHLQFCCVLSILALTELVLMELISSVNKTDSVSLLRLPFLNPVKVVLYESSFVSLLKCP